MRRSVAAPTCRYPFPGEPVMENIAITSQYDIEKRKQMVKGIAGIDDGLNRPYHKNARDK